MKLAIVHDELLRRGGAEKVVLSFHNAFPNATIYTTAYNAENTYAEYKSCKIVTSWYNKLVDDEKKFKKLFFPFGILAMRMLDLTEYDVVLQSGTHCSKYVKVRKDALVLTYCYTPFRLAWNPESYSEYLSTKGVKRIIYDTLTFILRKIDKKAANRTDFFIAMTEETKQRIISSYNVKNEIRIIRPPVEIKNFNVSTHDKSYYFLLSRLEYYKKVDLVVRVFNKLGKKLIVVGRGSKENEIKAIANKNIEFKQGLSNDEVAELYSNCKCFLMPQHEDYGITPLEANACGKPVIAFAKGGVLETMVPFDGKSEFWTAVFFKEQTEEDLIEAITKFESLNFNPNFIREHAEKFDEPIFSNNIKNFVIEKATQAGLI